MPVGHLVRRFHGLCLVLVCGVAACDDAPPPASQGRAPAAQPSVYVSQVQLRTWPETVRVQGSLLGDEQSVVGSKLAGLVDEVLVDLGSEVRQGDPLVVLDSHDLELLVRQAEAQLAQACAAIGLKPDQSERELDREQSPPVVLERAMIEEARANVERGQELLPRRGITRSELERLETLLRTAEARYRSALNGVGEQIALIGVRRAELAVARQKLADTRIVAPFDGIVEQRQVAPGEYVQVGQAVVSLVRSESLRFTAGVPERAASRVREGQAVRIRVQGQPEPLVAKVSRVSPALNLSSRSLWVEADVPNPGSRLRAGLFGEAEIIVDPDARALTVPASAVREFAGIEKVWLVREGEASELPVRTGRRDSEWVEIVSGLSAEDVVITDAEEGQAGKVVAVRGSAAVSPERGDDAETGDTSFSE